LMSLPFLSDHAFALLRAVLHELKQGCQFDLCPRRLLAIYDVDQEIQVSLHTAIIAQSTSAGQRYLKCNCSGAIKCQTNRSKFFKASKDCYYLNQ